MKSVEQNVAQHYTHGSLERVILQALTEAGKDVDRLDPPDLLLGAWLWAGWSVRRPTGLRRHRSGRLWAGRARRRDWRRGPFCADTDR